MLRNTVKRVNEMDVRCNFCDQYSDDNTEWLELDVKGHEGDIACVKCQCDAASHFGQMWGNVKHVGLFQNMIIQWAKK